MKKLTSFFLVVCLCFTVILSVNIPVNNEVAYASETTSEKAIESSENQQIKNIIYMIPDGGGPTLMDLADMVKRAGGFDRTVYPNSTVTTEGGLNLLPYLAGFETTRSANSSVTDSGAGGTALSSGYKTNNGYIGVDTKKIPKATILELAKLQGKSVGICTTAEWPHATPASFTAHADDRNDYYNIYKQIENKEMDVVLGAGYGKVTDFEGATLDDAKARGYKIIRTPADAASVKPGDKLWGNVSSSSLPADVNNPADKASLPELTQAAITALSDNEKGFFLMVEGSWVDSGGHNSNAVIATSEYLAFDECWRIAVEFAKGRNDTIVIGAPDHDTGGLDFPETMTNEVELIQKGTNPSTFTWTGNGNHTGRNCPVWVYLPEGVDMLTGLSPVVGDSESVRNDYLIDNTAIAPYLATLIGGDLDKATEELFVDVSNIGVYMPSSKRFIFNNGDKYIHPNTDTYYKDGEAVDMNGKVAVYVGEKFYVPAEMVEEEDWEYTNPENPDIIEGSGTVADPYLIDSISDYKEFLIGMANTNYSGVYFRLADDLEFVDDADIGVDGTMTFAGSFDGDGNTITWSGEYENGVALFPKVSGTIANLGVEGELESTSANASASIAYSVLSDGKIINCYSNLDFDGNAFCGLAVKNEGQIINSYYGGNAAAKGGYALSEGGTYITSYYIENCGLSQLSQGVAEIKKTDSTAILASVLCGGLTKAQTLTDVELLGWECVTGLPEHEGTDPLVTRVRLYPENVSIGKGDVYQFDYNVDGRCDYSWSINWSMEPESELSGTYIDKKGVVHIDANETITSFTVMAKSKSNGGVADSSIVTVTNKDTRAYPVGSGTKEDPYLIRNEADFLSFTNALIGGENYKDKYFRQICDIDMADYPGYKGMGSNGKFYGTYDGYGHVINAKFDHRYTSSSQYNIFPYTWGTIMNLGTTGLIENEHSSGGICRSLRSADGDYGPGKIVNCWSSADVYGNYGGGIVPTNSGKVINCAAYGNVEYGTGGGGVISAGTKVLCYFTDPDYDTSSSYIKVTEEVAKTTLYATLNANREAAAEAAGLDTDDLVYWVKVDGDYPAQTLMYPYSDVVSKIEILPEGLEIGKGTGRQLAVSPSTVKNDEITWSITTSGISAETTVDEYGFVTVGSDEENKEITVKAQLTSDTSVYDELTFTVVKSSVPDGSKENPYLITSEADFLTFTKNVIAGETYKGKYFLQTRNLDMAGYSGYAGVGSNGKFYGTYNGGGHTINVALETDQGCLFPYTWGTIMNLGSTGYFKNEYSAGGIARSLRESDTTGGPGKIINCWSSAEVSGDYAGGMAPTARGDSVIAGCFFFGSVSWTTSGGVISGGGNKYNNYFVNDNYESESGVTKLTEQQMKTELTKKLNDSLSDSATKAGIDVADLIPWRNVNNSNPIHAIIGDINGTSKTELDDYIELIKLIAKQDTEVLEDYMDVADLDGDGNVTLFDAYLLLRLLYNVK